MCNVTYIVFKVEEIIIIISVIRYHLQAAIFFKNFQIFGTLDNESSGSEYVECNNMNTSNEIFSALTE